MTSRSEGASALKDASWLGWPITCDRRHYSLREAGWTWFVFDLVNGSEHGMGNIFPALAFF